MTRDSDGMRFSAKGLAGREVRVLRLDGMEKLSTPFRYAIHLLCARGERLDPGKLLGQAASLSIHPSMGEVRHVHGLLSRVEMLAPIQEQGQYRVELTPRLERLRHVRDCRIFQELGVPEVVEQLLRSANIACERSLKETYPRRAYCVQYRESTLHFIHRLLEEEGIGYFFRQDSSGCTLVLFDAPDAHGPLPGEARLAFRELSGLARGAEAVHALRVHQALASTRVMLRDFNPLRPHLDLSVESGKPPQDGELVDHEDYPGRYEDSGQGSARARVALERTLAAAAGLEGRSSCPRLEPGFTFELEQHPLEALNARYLVTGVHHRFSAPELLPDGGDAGSSARYENTFLAQPAKVPFRPLRLGERPAMAGPQTATVVGPAGEEIHTDEHGRIKVQFHWDREGKRNEKSSCWVRVSQGWAGPGMGTVLLPRVGHEVVVEFLEGDPDRPLVTGSVYNGANPPPLHLPAEKTQSTLKSASSKGSEGANELRFEDAAGSEALRLHAQKDWAIQVLHDKEQSVGGNERLSVQGDRTRKVDGNQSLGVKGGEASEVGGSQSLRVAGSRSTTVNGGHGEEVAGNQTVAVAGKRSADVKLGALEDVGAAKMVAVGGGFALDVGLASSEVVGGARAIEVAGLSFEKAGKDRLERVAGTKSVSVGRDMATQVGGGRAQGTEKDLKEEVGRHHLTEAQGHGSVEAKAFHMETKEFAFVVGGELALLINRAGELKIWGEKMSQTGQIVNKGSTVKFENSGSAGGRPPLEQVQDAIILGEYDQDRPGKLEVEPDKAAAFEGKRYTRKKLTNKLTVKRLYGGDAKPGGQWVTLGDRPTGLEGKIRMALKPEWSNNADRVCSMELPEGTIIYEGVVAPQGAGYPGGLSQICIELPEDVVAGGRAAVEKWLQALVK